jgi:hypothetical protein
MTNTQMPFYTLFILSTNSINEFCVDRKVCVNLESAYRTGQNILGAENVYGYVITKEDDYSWSVITKCVQGVDYIIGEHNGRIFIEEGCPQIVMV